MTVLDDVVISAVALDRVHPLRELYRKEMDAQIVHDSWHARGFTDLYGFGCGGELIGYAAVGGATREPRHTVKELFLLPEWRGLEIELFDRVVGLSGARTIEAQTNDRLLLRMFFDRASHWHVTHVLFADARTTDHPAPEGVVLRQMTDADRATVFTHTYEPIGEWGVERDGVVVATGGVMFHYNPPYGDLYMEVSAVDRRRGYGAYLVQELKRICREQGRVPAARCRPDNLGSRRTLVAAGLLPCAHILRGELRS